MMDSNSSGIMPVMPVGGGTDFGSNGFIWMFFLLVLLMGGNGFGWGGNSFANAIGYENLATSNEVQRGFDNQNNIANQRDILAAVTNGTSQTVSAVNGTFHDTVNALSDKYSELARDVANVQMSVQQSIANENECCCNTRLQISEMGAGINANISQNRYESALNTAKINENTTAQTQKILDAIAQNKIDTLQSQVNQLQLAQATSGMLKFPQSWAYNAGAFPPIFGCCGQTNI